METFKPNMTNYICGCDTYNDNQKSQVGVIYRGNKRQFRKDCKKLDEYYKNCILFDENVNKIQP